MGQSHSRQSPSRQINRFEVKRRQTRQWQFNRVPFAATRPLASTMARPLATAARASFAARFDASIVRVFLFGQVQKMFFQFKTVI